MSSSDEIEEPQKSAANHQNRLNSNIIASSSDDEAPKKKPMKSLLKTKTKRKAIKISTSTPKPKEHQRKKDSQNTESFDMQAMLDQQNQQQENNETLNSSASSLNRSRQSGAFNDDVEALIQRQMQMERDLREIKETIRIRRKKVAVNKSTRNYVKSCYAALERDFNLNKSLHDQSNSGILNELSTKVKGLDTSIPDNEINEAIKTYFNSRKYYEKKSSDQSRALARHHQRKVHKLKKRQNALEKRKITEEVKDKALAVLNLNFMSSEDERDDDFEVRPLRWRSQACDNLFSELDTTGESLMSPKARRQTTKRSMGPFSSRESPEVSSPTRWAVAK